MTPRPQLAALPGHFDLIVIGGGITGAGILAEATARGLRGLLLEQNDFASGTSSASSKLVHGGLRYLAGGHWRLTLESVRERNRLLRERPGLVERQPFLMPVYRGMRPGRRILRTGLAVYDLMGGDWHSRSLSAAEALALEPDLRSDGLIGAVAYDDASTDDARLTLKLIFEAIAGGAFALNYTEVTRLLHRDARVTGVAIEDRVAQSSCEITAEVVINAAGPAATGIPEAPAGAPVLRPLRGSHLIFPRSRLPVRRAVTWPHPQDRRPIFVYPWQGITLCGTTDVDHTLPVAEAPRVSSAETAYLMEGLAQQFPRLALQGSDASASYAGVRPIVAGGKDNPSAESRESALWTAPGYLGITGGKLTTFRLMASQVLKVAAQQARSWTPRIAPVAAMTTGDGPLASRYGAGYLQWAEHAGAAEAGAPIADSIAYTWAELRWAARHEQVVHLDDLLLRRTRLGLLLAGGGRDLLDPIGDLCRAELGWDAEHWARERARYLGIWQAQHAPPTGAAT